MPDPGDADTDAHRDADRHGDAHRDPDGDRNATATPTVTATPTATPTPTVTATVTPTPTVTATPIDNLPLRSDFTTGIFHASTDQTLTDGEFGGSVTTLSSRATATSTSTRAPLTTDGPALTTSDRGGARLWLANPEASDVTVTCAATFADYDADTGTETPIVTTGRVGQHARPRRRRGRVRGAGDESPGRRDRPGGPLLKLTLSIHFVSGSRRPARLQRREPATPATPSAGCRRTGSSAGRSAPSPTAATARSIPARTVI